MTTISAANPSAAAPATAAPPRRISLDGAGIVLLCVLVFGVPFLVTDYRVFQMTLIVVNAIALVGLNLLTGFSGQISLGNGAFYALGAYVAVIMMTKAGVPYWLTPPISAVVSLGAGYAFGRSVARLEGIYLALATFALAIALPQGLKHDALEHYTGGAQGIVLSKPASPFPSLLNHDRWLYVFCLAVAVVMFWIAWNLVRGRTGRALQGLRDHSIAAGTMGVDVAKYKALTFGVSAMFTGVAGALAAMVAGFISPDSYTNILSIQLLVGAVVGGIASIFWTVFGSAFILVVPDLAKEYSDAAPAMLYGVMLIVFMMVMPGGVAGLVRSAQLWVGRLKHARSQPGSQSRTKP